MSFQAYALQIQSRIAAQLGKEPPKSQPESVADVLKAIRPFVNNEKQVLELALPRFCSPRYVYSTSLAGNCQVICAQCGKVPLQHGQLDCKHVFCSTCLLNNMCLAATGSMICPKCSKQSANLRWHKTILQQIKLANEILCPHCDVVFKNIAELQAHELENPDFFGGGNLNCSIMFNDNDHASPEQSAKNTNTGQNVSTEVEKDKTNLCWIWVVALVLCIVAGAIALVIKLTSAGEEDAFQDVEGQYND